MPREATTTLGVAPPAPSFNCPTSLRLSRDSIPSGPISIMARTLEPAIQAALDAVEPRNLPRLRISGGGEPLRRALNAGLADAGFGPGWLAEWLAADVIFLVRLFQDLTNIGRLHLRLEAEEGDACTRFHTDNVGFRLVTTYRGPGTEWLPPHALADLEEGAALPEESIRRLDRGAVAIMRGSRNATAEQPGLLHRSPPIAGTGVTRLFFAIDDGLYTERR